MGEKSIKKRETKKKKADKKIVVTTPSQPVEKKSI